MKLRALSAETTLWLCLCILLCCPGGIYAEDKDPCKDPQTQTEINSCATWQYEQADKELNRLFKSVVSRISPQRQANLRAAQRVWIIFRDAHCRFIADGYRGSSMYPAVLYGCLTSVTDSRSAQLNEFLQSSAD
jgi:uncharacterized protein YecT (DUF1311 family)